MECHLLGHPAAELLPELSGHAAAAQALQGAYLYAVGTHLLGEVLGHAAAFHARLPYQGPECCG